MPITCECGKVHEAVPQATFDNRLKNQGEAIKALNAQLQANQAELEAGRVAVAQLAEAKATAARGEAWSKFAHVPEARRAEIESYYAFKTDGVENAPTLAAYLEAEAAEGIFSPILKAPAAAPPAKGAPPAKPPEPPKAEAPPKPPPVAPPADPPPVKPPETGRPRVVTGADIVREAREQAAKPKGERDLSKLNDMYTETHPEANAQR